MNGSLRVTMLSKKDKSRFIALMSSAFSRDPLFLHLFGDPAHSQAALKEMECFFSFMFDKSFFLHEEVWGLIECQTLLGAYIVEKPNASGRQKVKGTARLVGRLLPLLFQIRSSSIRFLNSYMKLSRSTAPSWPHHYLIMIGVSEDARGKGIGGALLNHLLANVYADPHTNGVALDTENKTNIALYKKFGFELNHETRLNGLPIYCMALQKRK
ncbi:GNAT family N-acetyltransferase [Paenibacillus sp. GCM10027627]|uniref:GNAT family N-acetyltransferase n=1 Tax=unclassified Paenibacillus TaxID=185978 RepID=UPI003639AAF2